MGKFKVLVSSESNQFCDYLSAVIGETDIFEVIGMCTSYTELLDEATRVRPDIVLWKVNGFDPLPTIKTLCLDSPFVIPVIVVDDPSKINLIELLRAGIRGCLPSRVLPRQIIRAMELITLAGVLCLPRFEQKFFNCHSKINGEGKDVLESLSEREHQILVLLGKSLSNQEMARMLFLSESTVKTHLRNLFRKLGVRNRSEALLLAVQRGLTNQNGNFSEQRSW